MSASASTAVRLQTVPTLVNAAATHANPNTVKTRNASGFENTETKAGDVMYCFLGIVAQQD